MAPSASLPLAVLTLPLRAGMSWKRKEPSSILAWRLKGPGATGPWGYHALSPIQLQARHLPEAAISTYSTLPTPLYLLHSLGIVILRAGTGHLELQPLRTEGALVMTDHHTGRTLCLSPSLFLHVL